MKPWCPVKPRCTCTVGCCCTLGSFVVWGGAGGPKGAKKAASKAGLELPTQSFKSGITPPPPPPPVLLQVQDDRPPLPAALPTSRKAARLPLVGLVSGGPTPTPHAPPAATELLSAASRLAATLAAQANAESSARFSFRLRGIIEPLSQDAARALPAKVAPCACHLFAPASAEERLQESGDGARRDLCCGCWGGSSGEGPDAWPGWLLEGGAKATALRPPKVCARLRA